MASFNWLLTDTSLNESFMSYYYIVLLLLNVIIFLTGINNPTIFLVPTFLEVGETYSLILEGSTNFSMIGIASYSFVANFPPYGGSCKITPDQGEKIMLLCIVYLFSAM